MRKLEKLIEGNRAWAESISAQRRDFFESLSRQQTPEYLWIGCSDSRVPATQLVGLDPGEMFVHRNVANVVVHTDLNCLSVIQFAVDVLRVRHIIVCGHYGCGGVEAAMKKLRLGLIDNWLRHVEDVRDKYEALLEGIADGHERFDRLCELNVIEQAINVCQTTVVRGAWQRGHELSVHGLIYSLQDGLLRDLDICITNEEGLLKARRKALADNLIC
ncbi:MAG TPA: carbonate dehydratase [Blastocatellia bacterium]|nr:carbonate dehydratase [Blastocatellia bacterium]